MFRRLFLFLGLTFALMMPAWASVDINTAGAAELEGLPGIGPATLTGLRERVETGRIPDTSAETH